MSILSDIFFNYLSGILNLKKKNEKFYYLSLIKEENGWSIHGLWPQYSENKYPSFCKKIDFNIETLNPILKELNENWYSNIDKNEDFWKHEWEKHGSCVFSEINEYEYFNKTLDLFKTAIQTGLPEEFYDKKDNKCLIPLSLDFKFILD